MSIEKVILEDGIEIPVQKRIKNICKKKRDELHITNQQISDGIYDMFAVDIPVSTIASFFAERSKAGSVYTTGYVCAFLGVSLDAQFGIAPPIIEDKTEIAVLRERIAGQTREINVLYDEVQYARIAIKRRRPVIWACLGAVLLMAAVVMWYVAVDLSSPTAGFFRPGGGYPIVGIVTLCIVAAAVITAIALSIAAEFKKRGK